MASGKKSFLLYCDIIGMVEDLPMETRGELFTLILQYVNDQDPIVTDLLLKTAFNPIKMQLKRDLKRYESIVESRRIAGLASADKRKQAQQMSTSVDFVQQKPTNPTDKETDNDTDNDIDIDKEEKSNKFIFKTALIKLGVSEQIASDWIKVRKDKKASNTETAFKAIKTQIELSGISANECIKIAVERSWSGFKTEWLNNIPKSETRSGGRMYSYMIPEIGEKIGTEAEYQADKLKYGKDCQFNMYK